MPKHGTLVGNSECEIALYYRGLAGPRQVTCRVSSCHDTPNRSMAAKSDLLAGKRLDSWKEIAAFLRRAERTVKRWEIERGLPVHRVPGGGRSAVFAYSNELAAWLRGKGSELEADEAGPSEITLPVQVISEVSRSRPVAAQVRSDSSPKVRIRSGLARTAAWAVPILLVGGLAIYLSVSHSGLRFRALANRHPANADMHAFAGPDSVAVLPFTNEQRGANTDYLSDGITESLIASLAHLPQLKVRSRDSVFRYKGKDIGVQTAGTNLRVSVVVSGRVMQHGDTIEVSAELTDVRDNSEIWGHRYVGKHTDLISLQQQMAGDIAARLRSTLKSADRQQITNEGTLDPEAYSLYLKGRYAFNSRSYANVRTAISYFDQAIARDPEDALAYSGLADAYSVLPFFGANPRECSPKSNAAARKALELDPSLAHPHAILGTNEMQYDWDFAGGESEFRKAFELDPNDATAHQWYAENLAALGGREQEALAEINKARELDPQSPIIRRVIGSVLVAARRFDEAIAVCRQLENEDPTNALAHDCLGYAYWGKRMYAEAVNEWKAYGQASGNPEDIEFTAALDRGFHSAGWNRALTDVIAVVEAQHRSSYYSPLMIARYYSDLGDKEKAFAWLNIAYREHDWLLMGLNTQFQLDPLRSDPRFAELVSRVGLPKIRVWRRTTF